MSTLPIAIHQAMEIGSQALVIHSLINIGWSKMNLTHLASLTIVVFTFGGCKEDSNTSARERRASESTGSEIVPLTLEPVKVTKRTKWSVDWHTLTIDGQVAGKVGESTFNGTFDHNWKRGVVFQKFKDSVGFNAVAEINMPRTGLASFTVGGDDGFILAIDGNDVINDWGTHSYREKTVKVDLSPGKHILTLQYLEWTKDARVSFDCDHDLLVWKE